MHVDVEEYLQSKDEQIELIRIREEFEKDFIAIIKLVNSSKFKTTKASQMPSKASMIKMHEVMINKEIFYEDEDDINDIRVIDNTIRLYGISKLILESEILEIQNGTMILGDYSDDFLIMNTAERCKFLLESYIKADIDELKRINELKLKTDYSEDYSTCRNVILKYLKKAPF